MLSAWLHTCKIVADGKPNVKLIGATDVIYTCTDSLGFYDAGICMSAENPVMFTPKPREKGG